MKNEEMMNTIVEVQIAPIIPMTDVIEVPLVAVGRLSINIIKTNDFMAFVTHSVHNRDPHMQCSLIHNMLMLPRQYLVNKM